jgi:transcription elongation GreA/GreB family factor
VKKESIIQALLRELEERKASINNDIAALEESKNNDTKSSMGDKYETSREMAQAEWNKLQERKGQIVQQIHVLQQIQTGSPHQKVNQGSLVITPTLRLFFAIPFGKFNFNETEWMGVSLHSPIGKAFEGKKNGEIVEFNQNKYPILQLE